MSKRNMIQTAEKARGQLTKNKHLSCYDLSIDEISELYIMSRKEAIKAITTAFNYGFVLGTRARQKERIQAL